MTDPNYAAIQRLAAAHDHGDLNAEASRRNLHAILQLASDVTCESCELIALPTPGPAGTWVLDQVHELGCPAAGENQDDDNPDAHWHTNPLAAPFTWPEQ